eukprot:gnl/MRDRNA2_/MRDRNA2_131355_c0_seq1.p1 gnl/MRDRNA2_/MRDRNA2_131355_c0~~gnl/MRDRNA2_/MRDRNA2_131355_c0_seq1.p1  ORF type:complete len:495 (+),score=107.64 gnl/MRDRNA2_/MRDRNA2_131355_c0_seq1:76-1560(+)
MTIAPPRESTQMRDKSAFSMKRIYPLTAEDKLVAKPMYTIPCSVPLEVAYVGPKPIRLFDQQITSCGYYYEIKIDSVADGATVGLALGVTSVKHEADEVRLSAVKPSYTAGYDGLMQAEDSWSEINWTPGHLRTGDRIGVLITPGGDFVLVENGELRINEPIGVKTGLQMTADLYAIVLASQGVELSIIDTEPPTLSFSYVGVALPKSVCEVIPITISKDVHDGICEVARQIFVSEAACYMAAFLAALESAPGMGARPKVWKLAFPTERGKPDDWEDFICPVDYLEIEMRADVEMGHEYQQDLFQEILRVSEAAPPEEEAEKSTIDAAHAVFGWEMMGGGWVKWYEAEGMDENTCTHDHQFCVPTLMIYSHAHSGEMVGWLRRQTQGGQADNKGPQQADLQALASAFLGRCEVLSQNIPKEDEPAYPNMATFLKHGEKKPTNWDAPVEYQKEWDEFMAAWENFVKAEKERNPDYRPTMGKLFPGLPPDLAEEEI